MQILDVSIVQFVVPVAVVILCVFLVFALGFKSPGTPPVLDIREEDEKVQKTKKNVGKKSLKSAEARVKQAFVPPVLKQVNNVHNNVKATPNPVVAPPTAVTPPLVVAVEKVAVVEQPKPKVKKVNKKVDENANISTLPEEVGDWTTAVSKKGRKKKDALAEVTNVPKQEIFTEEEVVAGLGAEKLEQQNVEKKNGKKKKKSSPVVVEDKVEEEKIVVEESVAVVEESVAVVEKEDVVEDVVAVEEVVNDVVDASEESKKKKQKKKNKKADKVVVEEPVIVEEPVVVVEEPVVVVEEPVVVVEEPVVVVEAVEVDNGNMEVVKKKKKPESRKKFQEVPLAVTELEVTNGEELKVQQPAPPTSTKKSKKAKNEATKPSTTATIPEADSNSFTSSNVELTSKEEDGDWKQAKPIRRKKQVQREH